MTQLATWGHKLSIPVLWAAILLVGTEASAIINPGYRGLSDRERATVDARGPAGVSVNTHTGNVVVQRILFSILGKGLPIHMYLTYNSDHRLISSPFGFGWNFSYNIRYTRDAAGSVVIVWGGRAARHLYVDGGHLYFACGGVYDADGAHFWRVPADDQAGH